MMLALILMKMIFSEVGKNQPEIILFLIFENIFQASNGH